ncbi:hypothetical protein BAUCODRAFT_428060 [Baudoinia panamericana UAMH 10762]|uniref:Uncharacterized protein n=1 Tax=Baudoinia panamericana (strain UAMH 10762) TaxID=717646 RepID=M2NHJ3_BAUPA|nr:uncharacterized protein BAUCODRAFT_428060 [Baudoinia panamericana UAMH 10762]EMC98490.1 hypothetical protein BAUCODRAFT_428060 [Baudoinia panamericana UAMH 10762]
MPPLRKLHSCQPGSRIQEIFRQTLSDALSAGGKAKTTNPKLIPGGKTAFRHVPEGRGGILNFRKPIFGTEDAGKSLTDQDHDRIHYLGVTGVKTCVGVYFALDDNRCFLAHINAWRYGGTRRLSLDEQQHLEEGSRFKSVTIEMLRKHSEKHDWDPREPRILQSLLIVCPEAYDPLRVLDAARRQADRSMQPNPTRDRLRLQSGWWLIEGIKQFLGPPPETRHDDQSEGFVVEHHDQSRLPIKYRLSSHECSYQREGEPPELERYELVEEAIHHPELGNWMIGERDGVIQEWDPR